MFDIGFTEILVIAVVALVVLGPERLPKAARFAGVWVRRARNQWDSVKTELERELAAEELQRNLQSVRQAVRDTEQNIHAGAESLRREVEQAQAEVESAMVAPEAAPPAERANEPAIEPPAAASTETPATEPGEVAEPAEPDPQADLFGSSPRADR